MAIDAHVLIVDDELNMRKVLGVLLEQAGFTVSKAEHGEEAMRMVRVRDPDVVLSDLSMPVMDGLAFLEWLRSETHRTLPALVLSSTKRSSVAQEVKSSGATEFISKPVSLPELRSCVSRLLSESEQLA